MAAAAFELSFPVAVSPKVSDGTRKYTLLQKLGQGAYGAVYRALTPRKVNECALKVSMNGEKCLKVAQREITFLNRLEGVDHVVGLKEGFLLSDRSAQLVCEKEQNDKGRYAIAMDLIEGEDLWHLYHRNDFIPLSQIRSIARQGLEALQILQGKGIVHRDIRLQNLIYNSKTDQLTLIDFGWAADINHIKPTATVQCLAYRAPEQLLSKPYDIGLDVYSFGVVLFQLIARRALIRIPGKTTDRQAIIDHLFLMEQQLGPLPSKFIWTENQQDSAYYVRGPDGTPKINGKPSPSAQKWLNHYQSTYSPDRPVWESRILDAMNKRCESPQMGAQLIALLAPMLRIENRITPDEALRTFPSEFVTVDL